MHTQKEMMMEEDFLDKALASVAAIGNLSEQGGLSTRKKGR